MSTDSCIPFPAAGMGSSYYHSSGSCVGLLTLLLIGGRPTQARERGIEVDPKNPFLGSSRRREGEKARERFQISDLESRRERAQNTHTAQHKQPTGGGATLLQSPPKQGISTPRGSKVVYLHPGTLAHFLTRQLRQ